MTKCTQTQPEETRAESPTGEGEESGHLSPWLEVGAVELPMYLVGVVVMGHLSIWLGGGGEGQMAHGPILPYVNKHL